MKKTIVFTALLSLLFLTDSCQALHRGIPKADRNRGEREVVLMEGETTVLRNVQKQEKPVVSEELATVETPADPATEKTEAPAIDQVQTSIRPDLYNEDTVYVDEVSSEAKIDEALESERAAKNAHGFSFVPLLSIIFFPALLVGIIGTLVCLSHFNRYEYVTEEGLDYKRRAIRTLIITCILSIFLAALGVLLILLIL